MYSALVGIFVVIRELCVPQACCFDNVMHVHVVILAKDYWYLALCKSPCFHDFQTQTMTLRRNTVGQLGFHVQFEGLIADVEQSGFAWQAGLRQGSRLVEVCYLTAHAIVS